MGRLAQRFEQRRAQRHESVAVRGVGTASRPPLQIEGRNQLGQDRLFHVGRQVQGLDPGVDGRPAEGEGGQPRDGQALGFGELRARAPARGPVGRFPPCQDTSRLLLGAFV